MIGRPKAGFGREIEAKQQYHKRKGGWSIIISIITKLKRLKREYLMIIIIK